MATIRKLRGRWQGQVRRKGMQPRAKSFDSKSEAEKWARNLEADLDRCGSMPDTRLAEQMTVHALLTRYRSEITSAKRSAQTESIRIGAMLRRTICYRTLAILSPTDIAVYRDERLKVVSGSTVLKELNVLGHAIDIARKEWGVHLPQNPCRMIRRPAPSRPRDRRLEVGEEQKLLDATDTGRNPYMRSLIILALETAMRQGELLSLSWTDIDLDRRIAHLDMTKNGESRDVPLSKRAIETLQRLADQSTGALVLWCYPFRKAQQGKHGDTSERARDYRICVFTICVMRL